MKLLSAILVDDEVGALQTLSGMLTEFCPQVDIRMTCDTIEAAHLAIQKYQPDLLFLDIEMPPSGQGFDLLRLFPERNFNIIFTTAHPSYAVKAINEVQPIAYLVKPFRVSALTAAVTTAYKHRQQVQTIKHSPDRLLVHHPRKGTMVIPIEDILYCHADQRTTDIYYLRDEHKLERATTSDTLKAMEETLPSTSFCRTHHAYLVNLQQIVRYQRTGRNGLIHLPCNCTARISVLKMKIFETSFRAFMNL